MKFIQGQNRTQAFLFPVSLDQSVGPDNEVRLIDIFADSLPLADIGFVMDYKHPYVTINRQWGYNYILAKKRKELASSDVGFMFIAYNLRRIINIIGQKRLRECLQVLLYSIFHPWRTIMVETELFLRPLRECRKVLLNLKYLFNLNRFTIDLLNFI